MVQCRQLQGSCHNKIHPRGNPAVVRSIPMVFPQHSYPHPRETRRFRRIPAVPVPMHTSGLNPPPEQYLDWFSHSAALTIVLNTQTTEHVTCVAIDCNFKFLMTLLSHFNSVLIQFVTDSVLTRQRVICVQGAWKFTSRCLCEVAAACWSGWPGSMELLQSAGRLYQTRPAAATAVVCQLLMYKHSPVSVLCVCVMCIRAHFVVYIGQCYMFVIWVTM